MSAALLSNYAEVAGPVLAYAGAVVPPELPDMGAVAQPVVDRIGAETEVERPRIAGRPGRVVEPDRTARLAGAETRGRPIAVASAVAWMSFAIWRFMMPLLVASII